ncbi:MAG TPA: hypothetical protein VGA50_14555 [Kiloniellales bacterium]
MGLLKRPVTQDELLIYEGRSKDPAEGQDTKIAGTGDDGDPLSAARGTVLAVVLGGIIWAVVLWVLL